MDTRLAADSLASAGLGTACCPRGAARHGVPAGAGMLVMLVAMADTMLPDGALLAPPGVSRGPGRCRPGGGSRCAVLDDCRWPSVSTAVRYFEINTDWQPEPIDQETWLRAYRLPDTRVEPSFESFKPFGLDSAH